MALAASAAVAQPDATAPSAEKKKLKPCCVCPETKKVRDECVVMNGEDKCGDLIEAHKACMRGHGFSV